LRPVLAQRAAALLTVSKFSANALSRRLGVSADRFSIVPNSAEHVMSWPRCANALSRYGLKKGYLLAVGTQSANKNIAALIAAHAQTDAPDLVLVGGGVPGVQGTEFENSGRVHALGRVPDADLRALYEGASAFVFPSLYEGFGIPPLEAMQLGVPVLCARSGAMPEVLGTAPMWFNPREIGSMIDARTVFAQADHGAMVAAGLRCAANYTWRNSALGLVDVVLCVDHRIAQAA
jgi:glycosyltransferase involved in cell wall biosynthesis